MARHASGLGSQLGAELALEDLAVGVAGQRVDAHPPARHLVAGQRGTTVCFERRLVEPRAGGGHDDGSDDLAPQVIGNPDDCDVGDVWCAPTTRSTSTAYTLD